MSVRAAALVCMIVGAVALAIGVLMRVILFTSPSLAVEAGLRIKSANWIAFGAGMTGAGALVLMR